jgi:competence protein ComEA
VPAGEAEPVGPHADPVERYVGAGAPPGADGRRPEARAAPVERPPRGARPLRLPDTLTGGRLDPGRRGVAALLLVAVVAAACAAGVALRARPQEVVLPQLEQEGQPLPGAAAAAAGAAPGPGAPEAHEELVVAVAGEVRAPGVVRLPAGSRVDDAVEAAGGLVPGASAGLLNLARRLVDGEQVLVGIEAPPGSEAAAEPAATGAGGLLDLNGATVGDLDGLPGIGPVLAQRIVDRRSTHGPFQSVDQLREVTGIGESKYADIKDKVTVG